MAEFTCRVYNTGRDCEAHNSGDVEQLVAGEGIHLAVQKLANPGLAHRQVGLAFLL